MDLSTYIADPARRQALASACATSPNYLWQIATRWKGRRPSPDLASRIEAATSELGPFTVSKESLIFPDAQPLIGQQLTPVTKRALRARLCLASDAHLAKVLKLPAEQVAAWPEEQGVPALPQVLQLLGVQEQPAADAAPNDPDAQRVIQVQVA